MSARKRSLRKNRSPEAAADHYPALLEALETRLVLSDGLSPLPGTVEPNLTNTGGAPPVTLAPPGQKPTISNVRATPQYHIQMQKLPDGQLVPLQSPGPQGYTPIQVQTAYGVNLVSFGPGIQGDGAGQTIAVIDDGNNPAFQPTGPNFKGSALQVFDQTFGLADPPSFEMYNETGWDDASRAGARAGARNRPRHRMVALDRPGRQARDRGSVGQHFHGSYSRPRNTAVTKLGASVVSMSFGGRFRISTALARSNSSWIRPIWRRLTRSTRT